MRVYRLQSTLNHDNDSPTARTPSMTSLVPSQSLSFPTISTPTWYIPPQVHKRSPDPHNPKKQGQVHQIWMAPWTDDNEQQLAKTPPSPVRTGPEHWEEQRRKWTRGFPVPHYPTEDVVVPLFSLEGEIDV
jgi:hypothetical protein